MKIEEREAVELTFAAALYGREATGLRPLCFVTPPDALRTLGPVWALDLQAAVRAWQAEGRLLVDATSAPGYAIHALERGLLHLHCPVDHPAFNDLSRYAAHYGGTLQASRPAVRESWTPALPARRQKHPEKSATSPAEANEEAPRYGNDGR